ncbi:MAG: hypothetical protein WCL32_20275 [Planctomycetota bacterium]
MSIVEIMPAVEALSRSNKLQLAQLLINGLADADSLAFKEGQVYPIYTPEFGPEAAAQLSQLLESGESKS